MVIMRYNYTIRNTKYNNLEKSYIIKMFLFRKEIIVMNKVMLLGRLTRDPEIRYSQQGDGQMVIARYTLAVDRRFGRTEQQTADFISCVAFGRSAEFAEKYLKQGTKIAIVGRIQTGSYTNKDGNRVYTTDIVVEEQEFAESKNAQSGGNGGGNAAPSPMEAPNYNQDGFMNIPDGIEDDLPFN